MKGLKSALIVALCGAVVAIVLMVVLSQTPAFKERTALIAQQQADAQAAEEHAATVQETIAPYADATIILPNVYIGDVCVGDMTVDEATKAVTEAVTARLTHTLTVHLPDRDLTFSTELNDLESDVDTAVYSALCYGRGSSDAEEFYNTIVESRKVETHFDFTTAATFSESSIREEVEAAAADAYIAPVQTTVDADQDAQTIVFTKGVAGLELDSEALISEIISALRAGNYDDITFDYSTIEPEDFDLEEVYDKYCWPAQDAYYDSKTESVVESVVGYEPDVSASRAQATLWNMEAGETMTVTYTEVEPEIDTATFSKRLFRDTLCSYGSPYSSNANRTENLRLACAAIDGTVIQPGEVFSFNDTVGERTTEKGYRDAVIYVDNSSEMQAGGGVCQVASTIYYCCLYAELEVLEREPHMFRVTYVPDGMDTTIYWQLIDFKFRNNTDYPIKISAYLSGGRCYISLKGTDLENHVVKITSTATDSTNLSWRVVRKVYDSTGWNLLKEEDLGISTYQAH